MPASASVMHSSEFGIEAGFACVKADEFPNKRGCQNAPLEAYDLKHPWHFTAIRKIAEMVDKYIPTLEQE